MPNIKSAKKRVLVSAKKTLVNKDNKSEVKTAIKKLNAVIESGNYEELMYEGYGPAGTAVMLDILTDNRNRTAADVRHIFSKFGGNLGQDGCVAWMFKKKAVFIVEKETFDDEDALMEIVLDAGAEDMSSEGEVFEITAEPDAFDDIEKALGEKGIETASAEVTMVPDTTVHLAGKDAEKMQNLIDALEENDDVQNVYSNYDIDEE